MLIDTEPMSESILKDAPLTSQTFGDEVGKTISLPKIQHYISSESN